MIRKQLTDRLIAGLEPAPSGKRYEIFDTKVYKFGVRVTDRGAKSFILYTSFPGSSPARRRIGRVGLMTLDTARRTAKDWLDKIEAGIDPAAEKRRQRSTSFGYVAEEYLRLAVIGKQYRAAAVQREVRRELIARWGDRPVTSITAHDLIALMDEVVGRGAPYQAHVLYGHVRRIFNWAIGRGIYGVHTSPCDRLRPADAIGQKKLSRSRVLTDHELRAFWSASRVMGYPYGPLFQLLALTGQRRSEVGRARWPEFDLESRLWTIPAARTRTKVAHAVPLTADMIVILETLPRFKRGDYLFTSTFGVKPVNDYDAAKERLDSIMRAELGELPPFVLHDVRRTMRTGLSALPVPGGREVRELVIAHTQKGIQKVYDLYAYLDEKRKALELWSDRLRSIVGPAS
jgi:integrase